MEKGESREYLTKPRTQSTMGKNRKEDKELQSIRSAFRLEEPQESRRHAYPYQSSFSCTQFWVTIVVATIISLLIALISAGSLVAYLENQRSQLQESDSSLANEAQVADANLAKLTNEKIETLHINMTQMLAEHEEMYKRKIMELEANFTERLTELKESHAEELRVLEKSLNSTEEMVINVRATIEAVNTTHTVMAEELRQMIDETDTRLTTASDKLRELRVDHSLRLDRLDMDLNETTTQLSEVQVIITTLDSEINTTSSELDTLNTDTDNMIEAISERVTIVEREKATKIELEELSQNLTSLTEASALGDNEIWLEIAMLSQSSLNETHREQIHDFIEMLASNSVNQSQFETLVARVTLQENATAENQVELEKIENVTVEIRINVEQLTQSVVELAQNNSLVQQDLVSISDQLVTVQSTKVDVTEFEILSSNVTILAQITSQTDQELRDNIDDLSNGSINRTHHDELQDIVNMFARTKANQSDFESLSTDVSTLSASLVLTQININTLNANITKLDTADKNIRQDLGTKAEEQELTTLKSQVTQLQEDTNQVRDSVTGLKLTKANVTELMKVTVKVNNLNKTVTDHASTMKDLDSAIRENKDNIGTNSDKISNIENTLSSSFLLLRYSLTVQFLCMSITTILTVLN